VYQNTNILSQLFHGLSPFNQNGIRPRPRAPDAERQTIPRGGPAPTTSTFCFCFFFEISSFSLVSFIDDLSGLCFDRAAILSEASTIIRSVLPGRSCSHACRTCVGVKKTSTT
jgi:hypothetical protein